MTLDALSSPVLLAPFRQIADEFDEVAAGLGNRAARGVGGPVLRAG